MPTRSKEEILERIIASLRRELEACIMAAREATAAATDPGSKAENKYDTRSLEASYLARGQALRVSELHEAVLAFEALNPHVAASDQAILLGVLVVLADKSEEVLYFLGPCAGGTSVEVNDEEILVITPASPLGMDLMGKRAGDTIRMRSGAKMIIKSVS